MWREQVKEAVTHVEALRDVSTQAVTSMHELKMQNLARGDGGSGTSNEATLAVILEHLNPEISSMREAVHSLQAKLGERDPGEDGAEEDEGNADSGEQKGPVLVQLAKLWAAVEGGPSAQRFDALAAQADSTQEQVAEMNQHLDRQLAALKKSDSASPSATSADTPSNVSELLDRLEKVRPPFIVPLLPQQPSLVDVNPAFVVSRTPSNSMAKFNRSRMTCPR